MNLINLQQKNRLFFTIEDLAKTLNIKEASASVLASRYVKKGYFLGLKKNMYILKETASRAEKEALFRLSNVLQTPSYISLLTALSYYGVTTQMTREAVEAVNPVRSVEYESGPLFFSFRKIQKKLYFGFSREQSFFIATPEKALLDALYLQSLGEYELDASSLDLAKINKKSIEKIAKKFPFPTQKLLEKFLKNSS